MVGWRVATACRIWQWWQAGGDEWRLPAEAGGGREGGGKWRPLKEAGSDGCGGEWQLPTEAASGRGRDGQVVTARRSQQQQGSKW